MTALNERDRAWFCARVGRSCARCWHGAHEHYADGQHQCAKDECNCRAWIDSEPPVESTR